jgi:hypothetical protein
MRTALRLAIAITSSVDPSAGISDLMAASPALSLTCSPSNVGGNCTWNCESPGAPFGVPQNFPDHSSHFSVGLKLLERDGNGCDEIQPSSDCDPTRWSA